MDNFTYFYEGINHNQKKKTNKLLSVADNVSSYSLPGYVDLKPNLSFIYSSAGQRIGKVVKPAGSAPADWDYTYYILDAQGNTMSTYNLKGINIYQDRIYTECISVIVQ